MKKALLLLLTILCFQTSDASHAAGGEIWYEHDTLNTYTVHFRFYRDCTGIAAPTNVSLYYRSNSLSVSPNFIIMNQDTNYVSSTCQVNTCLSPASVLPGYEVYEYHAVINLSAPANDWYFWIFIGARNPSQNIAGGNLYVDATLDNLNTPFNNSAVPFLPIDIVQIFNSQSTMNFPLLDTDGDSLDIHFAQPLHGDNTGAPVPIAWSTGYSINNPFGTTPAPILNQTSGNLTMYSGLSGQMSFAVNIDEYRNGVKIASSVRDYQFVYGSNTSNSAPELSGVNNTSSYVTSINVCPNASLSFFVNSSDPNPTDTTLIISQYIPNGATFNTNNAQNQVGTFNWTPTISDVRSQPYIVSLKVRDNHCAEQSYGYQIFVNNCNPDSVWAGDANADFTCDNYDVLNIGLANGTTGNIRPGATTNWQAEWCLNWPNTFLSNLNYKHADCNGDGIVNSSDLPVITANYGLVHQKQQQIGQYKTLGLPDLYCDVSNVQAHRGSTVSIPIMLGTIGSEMNNFYGIAASVELLNAKTSAPISVNKNVSWIGNVSTSFEFEKSITPNKTAFTFVKNDQQHIMNGQGQIGAISFPIDASSVVGSKVIVQFSNIRVIDKDGEQITDYNVLSDTLEILGPLNVNDVQKTYDAFVYPNPNHGKYTLSFSVNKTSELDIVIYDITGRRIENNVTKRNFVPGQYDFTMDMTDKSPGQYLIEIKSEEGKEVIPIQKW